MFSQSNALELRHYLPGGSKAETDLELRIFLNDWIIFRRSMAYKLVMKKNENSEEIFYLQPIHEVRKDRLTEEEFYNLFDLNKLIKTISRVGSSPNLFALPQAAIEKIPEHKEDKESQDQEVEKNPTSPEKNSPIGVDIKKALGSKSKLEGVDDYLFNVLKDFVLRMNQASLKMLFRNKPNLNNAIDDKIADGDDFNFVIIPTSEKDKTPKLIIGKKKHCFLAGGKPVYTAGAMNFSEGKLTSFNASSGGYKPDDKSFIKAIKFYNQANPECVLPLEKFTPGAGYVTTLEPLSPVRSPKLTTLHKSPSSAFAM